LDGLRTFTTSSFDSGSTLANEGNLMGTLQGDLGFVLLLRGF
jgi:hypothetical protein